MKCSHNTCIDYAKKFQIHGRTHLTGVEFTDNVFGNEDEICSNCIISLSKAEIIGKIRYRTGIDRLLSVKKGHETGPSYFLNPSNRRSTHSRWHGRICGLVIETNENVYGPFFADTCGYEVWTIIVDTDLVTFLTDNAITNDGVLIGFTTEPKKGRPENQRSRKDRNVAFQPPF